MDSVDKEFSLVFDKFIKSIKRNFLLVLLIPVLSVILSIVAYKFSSQKYVANVVLDSSYLGVKNEYAYNILLGLKSQIESTIGGKNKLEAINDFDILSLSIIPVNEYMISVEVVSGNELNISKMDSFILSYINESSYVKNIIDKYNVKLDLELDELESSLSIMDSAYFSTNDKCESKNFDEDLASYFEVRNNLYSRIGELKYRKEFVSGYLVVKSSEIGLRDGRKSLKSYLLISLLLSLVVLFLILVFKK